jgi:hypothetical protein
VSRSVVFLLLPHLFSKHGRQALLAYAFVLALTGPAKNTLHNTEIMSESLACGQVFSDFLYVSEVSAMSMESEVIQKYFCNKLSRIKETLLLMAL